MIMSNMDVFDLDALTESIRKAEQKLQDAREELRLSEALLADAKAEEAAKCDLQVKAQSKMAAASATGSYLLANRKPLFLGMASSKVVAASVELDEAIEECQRAKEHREQLEHRLELARKTVDAAQAELDKLILRYPG